MPEFLSGSPLNLVRTVQKPTLDDLCASMARFLNCVERADPDVLEELIGRVATVAGLLPLSAARLCSLAQLSLHLLLDQLHQAFLARPQRV